MAKAKTDLDALDVQARSRAVRGSLLFHLALAEALAGDALAGRPPPETVGGWALDVGPDGYEVVALGVGDAPDVLARVTFAPDGRAIVEVGGGGSATARQIALAAAREAAADYGATLGGRWLALPVPPPRDTRRFDRLEACLVRLPGRPDDLVAGPHWRLAVAGREVTGAVLACGLDLTVPDVRRGRAAAALVHADDDTPSELHVFLSLRHGVALEVRTPRSGLRWRVDGERITRA